MSLESYYGLATLHLSPPFITVCRERKGRRGEGRGGEERGGEA